MRFFPTVLLLIIILFNSCGDDTSIRGSEEAIEANSILSAFTDYGGAAYDANNSVNFPIEAKVYIPSIYGVNYKLRNAVSNPSGPICTFPLYRGLDSDGNELDYIITEASNQEVAEILGVPFTPRIAASNVEGRQDVTITNGIIRFKGKVDFSGTRSVIAGTPGIDPNVDGLTTFPPAGVVPGATADAEWSSFCFLPSGVVLNAQPISNSTGIHDRIPHHGNIGEDNQSNPYLDRATRRVSLQLLDGWHGGSRYFYHIVTDTNDPGPAAIELGVYAPRLTALSDFGIYPNGAYLPFSPTSNGPEVMGSNNQADIAQSQGLNIAVQYNQEIDPVNVFPIGPNDPNFSPMWEAHVSQWTLEAISNGDVRIITGTSDLADLTNQGLVTDFIGNISNIAPSNIVGGLKSTGLLINCPVVSQPEDSAIGNEYGTVLKP